MSCFKANFACLDKEHNCGLDCHYGDMCGSYKCHFGQVLLGKTLEDLIKHNFENVKIIFGYNDCKCKNDLRICGLKCINNQETRNCSRSAHRPDRLCTYENCQMRQVLLNNKLSSLLDIGFLIFNETEYLEVLREIKKRTDK